MTAGFSEESFECVLGVWAELFAVFHDENQYILEKFSVDHVQHEAAAYHAGVHLNGLKGHRNISMELLELFHDEARGGDLSP